MICAILLSAGFAAYLGANVTVNVNDLVDVALKNYLERELNSSFYLLQKPYSYIVSMVGSYVCMQNGTTGTLQWYSTNLTKVEMSANGNLTNGGVIYCKDIQWQTSITLGANVEVIQFYNGAFSYFGSYTGAKSEATFIIDESGGTYRAWYGANSTLAYSSTNASNLIYNLIGNCTAGNIILVKNGIYQISKSPHGSYGIVVDKQLTICGLGNGTVFNCTDIPCIAVVADYVVLRDFRIQMSVTGTSGSEGIQIFGSNGLFENLIIRAGSRGIEIGSGGSGNTVRNVRVVDSGNHGIDDANSDGYNIITECRVESAGDTGIQIYNSDYSQISNCVVINSTNDNFAIVNAKGCIATALTAFDGRTGLFLGGENDDCYGNVVIGLSVYGTGHEYGGVSNPAGVHVYSSGEGRVYGNRISDVTIHFSASGIESASRIDGTYCQNNTFSDWTIYAGVGGGYLFYTNKGNSNRFINFDFVGTTSRPSGAALRLNNVYDEEIINCKFINIPTTAISIGSEMYNTKISGCSFINCTTVLDNSGTNTMWGFGNVINGKPCENTGSALNATATTFSITHGLVGSPTGVWASFNTTEITGWTWTATSTQITITVVGMTATRTCYWNVIYKP